MSAKHVTPRDVTKELRPLMRLSLDQGWRHERTSNNHIKWISPTGGLVHSGQIRGSGDFRALRNLTSDLVKNGLRIQEEKSVSTGCCPHGVSYRELAKGIKICEDCVDANKTPINETVQALADLGVAGETVPVTSTPTTSLSEAIRAAMHPEQTVVVVTDTDTAVLERNATENIRTIEVRAVVQSVLAALPTRQFRTEQIITQARGRLGNVGPREVSYALRVLKAKGVVVNRRHGVWQWACVTELDLAALAQSQEPPPPKPAPILTIEESTMAATVTPITSGQLDTQPAPKAAANALPSSTDEDLRVIDDALEALSKVEQVFRRYKKRIEKGRAMQAALDAFKAAVTEDDEE